MAHEFAHEPDDRRYTLRVGGQLACIVDYVINGDLIALTRTYTQPPQRGHGYAAEFVVFSMSSTANATSSAA
jgi:predicted GNAT family acetyltransferase